VLQRALAYRPDDPALWELRVRCAENTKDEEGVRRELVKRFPRDPRHALELGSLLVSAGKQEEARKILVPLTRKGTGAQKARAHFQLARSYYRRDDLRQALGQMDDAKEADARTVDNVRSHLLRGRILEELGKLPEAAAACARALELDKESEEALLCLVRLSLQLGKRDDALAHLRRYTLTASDAGGLLLAAETYLKLGRPDDAFELATRVQKERFHEKAQRILGLVWLRRGDPARAVRHLEKADPDAVVLAGLLRGYWLLGNLREVELALDRAERLEKPPADLLLACYHARRVLARRAELDKVVAVPEGKRGDWAPALAALACAELAYAEGEPTARVEALLNKALADGVEAGPAYALRGRLALSRGRLGKALADGERAVKLSPRDGAGYYVRGRVRLERGAPGALADLEKAAELTRRKDAEVLHHLAEALAQAGRLKEAVATQQAAVRLRPKDREMAEQLAELEKRAKRAGA
jgi:tetratricopeptide (TPR) repeat protein